MTNSPENAGYEVIWLVRRLFRSLAAMADGYLKDDELSAADRAVMEFLYPDERLSVPSIASKYRVSRQHVQVTVNRLRSIGLMRAEANPRHKRSQLIRLSELGRETFAEIRNNEAAIVRKLFADLNQQDVERTRRLLKSLLTRCETGELP
jgi:DNA-binding MarR family transcriptional regulator